MGILILILGILLLSCVEEAYERMKRARSQRPAKQKYPRPRRTFDRLSRNGGTSYLVSDSTCYISDDASDGGGSD